MAAAQGKPKAGFYIAVFLVIAALGGYAAWRAMGPKEGGKEGGATIDELKQMARARGLTKIVFQASPGTHLERIFASRYPSFDSWLLGYRSFSSSFPLDQMKCTYGDLDTF